MISDIVRTEQVVVSSVLDNPFTTLGPNICTSFSYIDYWESPEAAKLAGAIMHTVNRGKIPSRSMVKAVLGEYKLWVDHPTFNESLPIALAELEAYTLLPHYRNRRIAALVANCYENVLSKPENAREYAKHLIGQLEAWI